MSWQPIETAPKDGTDIILLFPREDRMFEVLPRRRAARWFRGAWSVPHFDGNMPTHWHPFPEIPAAPNIWTATCDCSDCKSAAATTK